MDYLLFRFYFLRKLFVLATSILKKIYQYILTNGRAVLNRLLKKDLKGSFLPVNHQPFKTYECGLVF